MPGALTGVRQKRTLLRQLAEHVRRNAGARGHGGHLSQVPLV